MLIITNADTNTDKNKMKFTDTDTDKKKRNSPIPIPKLLFFTKLTAMRTKNVLLLEKT